MASQLKIDTARRNGSKSRGPVTPEGKAISATNAVKHGLRSDKILVLSNESDEKFAALLSACESHFAPATEFEAELVQEIAAARWRLRRAWAIETNLFDDEMQSRKDKSAAEGVRLARAFRSLADKSNALNLVTRYENRLRRNFQTALELLEKQKSAERTQISPVKRPEAA
jgi:hypothetical protein